MTRLTFLWPIFVIVVLLAVGLLAWLFRFGAADEVPATPTPGYTPVVIVVRESPTVPVPATVTPRVVPERIIATPLPSATSMPAVTETPTPEPTPTRIPQTPVQKGAVWPT